MDPHRKLREERTVLFLALAVIGAAAFLSTRVHGRLDLSEGRAWTLSSATRSLLAGLDEEVRITYYRSKALADRHPGPAAIEDFLREVEGASRGKVRARFVDPAKDPAAAEALGIAPRQMEVVERDERRVSVVYTGVAIELLERSTAIPAVLSTANLEYELVKAIRSLALDRRPVAAILPGDRDAGYEDSYAALRATLEGSGWTVREQPRGAPVDGDVGVLFVLGNADLGEADARAFDAYMAGGGSAFVAARGVDIAAESAIDVRPLGAAPFLDVLEAWGISLPRELALDEISLSVPFQTRTPTGAAAVTYVEYPHWVAVDGRNVDRRHPITRRFAGLDLYWPSPIGLRRLPGLRYSELASTSARGWRQTGNFAAGPGDGESFALEAESTRGRQLLAVAVEGAFPSAFGTPAPGGTGPTGAAPAIEASAAAQAIAAGKGRASRLVVVSSADAFTDLMDLTESSFNADFAALAADWLSGDEELLAVRARTARERGLDGIADDGAREAYKAFVYAATLGLAPGAALAALLARNARRRAREKAARRAEEAGR